MAGRRLTPDPVHVQPVSEIVDPSLAQPFDPGPTAPGPGMGPNVGVPPMVHPGMVQAQQDVMAAAAGIPGFEQANEPFASFHPEEGDEVEEKPEPITQLTDEERAEFSNILTIGRRSKQIDVYGHPVFIENLSGDDDLRVGKFCKEFQEAPPADSRAYQIAVVSCGIRTMDGKPLYQKIMEDESDEVAFQARLATVRKFMPPVLSKIYRAIMDLDLEFAELEAKLVKAQG